MRNFPRYLPIWFKVVLITLQASFLWFYPIIKTFLSSLLLSFFFFRFSIAIILFHNPQPFQYSAVAYTKKTMGTTLWSYVYANTQYSLHQKRSRHSGTIINSVHCHRLSILSVCFVRTKVSQNQNRKKVSRKASYI